jgi:hypothetical protein
VLLALLFIANACMSISPLADRADSRPGSIRIHSDQKLPERVVYDTRLPTIVPTPTTAESNTPNPAAMITEVLARTREAFAQMPPADANPVRPPEAKAEGEAATPAQASEEAPGTTRVPDSAATAL